jgi:hypothetical protein
MPGASSGRSAQVTNLDSLGWRDLRCLHAREVEREERVAADLAKAAPLSPGEAFRIVLTNGHERLPASVRVKPAPSSAQELGPDSTPA